MATDLELFKRIGQDVKDARWKRGRVAAGADANAVVTQGSFLVTSPSNVTNLPVAQPGQLEVAGDTYLTQTYRTWSGTPAVWVRTTLASTLTWSAWRLVGGTFPSLAAGSDASTVVDSGTRAVTSASVANLPESKVGWLNVVTVGAFVFQTFTTTDLAVWSRRGSNGTWTAWSRISADDKAVAALVESGTSTRGAITALVAQAGGGTSRADAFQPVRPEAPAWALKAPTMESRAAVNIPTAMSRDRLTVWSGPSNGGLMESKDLGTTWTTVYTFPSGLSSVRELANGELLAVVGVDPAPRELWLSQGYPTQGAGATWKKVHQAAAPSVTFSGSYGFFQWQNIVLFNEYGPKFGTGSTAEGGNARYAYMSTDYGKTWRTIFDLNTWVTGAGARAATTGIHLHGIAWDPYWDRLWITFGDDVSGTLYSDDFGATWEIADYGNTADAPHQNVAMLPMPKCILFGTDGFPNGVQRINRSEGKKRTGTYTIDQAYTIPGESGIRTHLCHSLYRVERPGDDGPAIVGFSAESNPGKSTVLASPDGYSWALLWQDPEAQPAGKGIRSVVGPTLTGELLIGSDDNRVSGRRSLWRGRVDLY